LQVNKQRAVGFSIGKELAQTISPFLDLLAWIKTQQDSIHHDFCNIQNNLEFG